MKKLLALLLSCFVLFAVAVPAAAVSQAYSVAELPAERTDVCTIKMNQSNDQYFYYVLCYVPASESESAFLKIYRKGENSSPEIGGFNLANRVDLPNGITSFTVDCDDVTLSVTKTDISGNAGSPETLIRVNRDQFPESNVAISDLLAVAAVSAPDPGTSAPAADDSVTAETAAEPAAENAEGQPATSEQTTAAPGTETDKDDDKGNKTEEEKSVPEVWKLLAIIAFVLAFLFAAAAVFLLIVARKKNKQLNVEVKKNQDLQTENKKLNAEKLELSNKADAYAAEAMRRRIAEETALRREQRPGPVVPERPVSFMESAKQSIQTAYRTGTKFNFPCKYVQYDQAESMMSGTPVFKVSATEKTHFVVFTDPDTDKSYLLPNPVFYNNNNCRFELSKGDFAKCITVVGAEKTGTITECTPTEVEADSAGNYKAGRRGRLVWR